MDVLQELPYPDDKQGTEEWESPSPTPTDDTECSSYDHLVISCVELLLKKLKTQASIGSAGLPAPVENIHPFHKGEYATDDFRMYSFKIKPCELDVPHVWTDCPFAHPGEKAVRRDPRKFPYVCTPCPDFKKGRCKRGDSCPFAHGVFERWLHPSLYRTQLCKDGCACNREICFFAHSAADLRPAPPGASSTHGQGLVSCKANAGSKEHPSFDTTDMMTLNGSTFCTQPAQTPMASAAMWLGPSAQPSGTMVPCFVATQSVGPMMLEGQPAGQSMPALQVITESPPLAVPFSMCYATTLQNGVLEGLPQGLNDGYPFPPRYCHGPAVCPPAMAVVQAPMMGHSVVPQNLMGTCVSDGFCVLVPTSLEYSPWGI